MLTQPLPENEARDILDRFHHDGFAVLRNVFSPDECAALRQLTDDYAADPKLIHVMTGRAKYA